MKAAKDRFSEDAKLYAGFRPHYPASLYENIYSLVPETKTAWDCGTGNGQVAAELSKVFENVYATDISEAQISHAPQKENIAYSISRAESTTFAANTFDLVTVAQAIHWFDFEPFYKEVNRTAKPGAVIAVWGYGLLNISAEIDKLIDDFYFNVIGPYWDAERKYLDEELRTIPFPFEEITIRPQQMTYQWTLEQLSGYLSSWSSVRKYKLQHNSDPVLDLIEKIKPSWKKEEEKEITFPLYFRVGKVKS